MHVSFAGALMTEEGVNQIIEELNRISMHAFNIMVFLEVST